MSSQEQAQQQLLKPIALTMGEPAGIGGEITLRAWLQRDCLRHSFFIIDDPNRLKKISQKFALDIPIKQITSPVDTTDCFQQGLPVLPVGSSVLSDLGHSNPSLAPSVIASIDMAVDFVKSGIASAITTNPVQKETLYQAGFEHPGHTEYLAHLADIKTPPVMLLASDNLRVVPVTVHESLKSAISSLSKEMIVEKTIITHDALQKFFAISQPRIAVAGLNPHAGESGALGSEEIEIILPAIETLTKMDINVFGPIPPDTLFSEQSRQSYDVAICMYHDQALIPIKTLDFDHAVNITCGLPFIRTSPDHGTALDIAETGQASPESLIAALNMATVMASNFVEQHTTSRAQNGLISA